MGRRLRRIITKIKARLSIGNEGIGVVEIILILVIIIGLIIIFKTQIGEIISDAFEAITGNTNTIIN